MTQFTVLFAAFASLSGLSLTSGENTKSVGKNLNQELAIGLFHDWMREFEREYETEKVKMERMMIWLENNAMITAHNNQKPPPSYLMGHNHFSDLTAKEYRQRNFLGEFSPGVLRASPSSPHLRGSSDEEEVTTERRYLQEEEEELRQDLPESVDWVKKGAVTSVKDQGMCGSCWAFSAVAGIEGRRFIETGQLESLSVQELLDCDTKDLACSGGLMDNAFNFDERSGGLCSEADYPYAAKKHTAPGCSHYESLCTDVPHTEVEKFYDVKHKNHALKAAIVEQPVSVAIQAAKSSFQFYKSGIYDPTDCDARVDHGVLAVGYGVENSTEYWLVKNSWGEAWGDKGYIKMSVNSPNPDTEGQCGILTMSSRPILKDNDAPASPKSVV